MDINYLLLLQNFREATGNVLTPFLFGISYLAALILVVLAGIVYWGIDKDQGGFLILNYTSTDLANQFVKVTAHVYRPWIRDSRVKPVEAAISSATGYSFPSGHTQAAVSVCGGLAWLQRKKHRLISIFCVIFILLTMFSRNYLGVHTPQDVICSMLLSIAVTAFNLRLWRWIQSDQFRPGLFYGFCIVLGIVFIAYVFLKKYPMDYIDGELIVDPAVMMVDSFTAGGRWLGFVIGMAIERRFICFKVEGTLRQKIFRIAAGVLLVGALHKFGVYAFRWLIGEQAAQILKNFLEIFFAVAIWPAIFQKLEKAGFLK